MMWQVEVVHQIDGNTRIDIYTAVEASVQLRWDGGRVALRDGVDAEGNRVDDVLYRDVQKITRRKLV